MTTTKMILAFKKILQLLPLILVILGSISIAFAGFIINKALGYFVTGALLIIFGIIFGYLRGGD
ncbi:MULTISPECIES: hypothetical protein [Lactobacillus]|uniref:hypothetical protein n=1 Tax=Lactobacillus TaxID=1578 RepID=UPI001C6A6C1E|nr:MULTISPECIES: hypothetical protein [Lactobacillus]MCO6528980.1 hypothetical protein [Lactobacillus sp.]MCO6530579.1 hypothetical protein [Lactobacillus sp.]QYN56985.1 hypothetical protein GYM69_07565 [Lactobacillus panisapium]